MQETLIGSTSELHLNLCKLLSEVSQGKIQVGADQVTAPLKDLGMDSVVLLGFLVAIEDMAGIEWPADVSKSVFGSIASIAAYLESPEAA